MALCVTAGEGVSGPVAVAGLLGVGVGAPEWLLLRERLGEVEPEAVGVVAVEGVLEVESSPDELGLGVPLAQVLVVGDMEAVRDWDGEPD